MLGITCLMLSAICIPLLSAADSATTEDFMPRPDFAGDWRQDHARSDQWDAEWRLAAYELQRRAYARQRRGDASPWVMGDARRQTRALMAKAQLADLASRHAALHISQTAERVRIDRRDEPPLICSTRAGRHEMFTSIHGTEQCRWIRDQLTFEIQLAEGTTIHHRFSRDAGGDTLILLTRVSGPGSPPVDLRRYFVRDDRSAPSFECVPTLTRGRVCSTDTGVEP